MHPTVIVINLDRDTSRMQHMRAQLQRIGMPFRRFSAINGSALPAKLAPYFDGHCNALSAGEVGCYASHLAICQDIVAGRIQTPALILEDDVEVSLALPQTLQRLLCALPAGWDIVRLSYPSKRAMLTAARLDDQFELVRYSQPPVSTGAYLLSRAGAQKFLARTPRNIPIDHDFRRVWAWKLKTYGVAPPPVRADALGVSSIDAMAPGARAQRWRSRRIRRQRFLESITRFQYGLMDFGPLRWLAVEMLNTLGRAVPRGPRRRLFNWARQAWGWQGKAPDSLKQAAAPSHIHAVGVLPDAAHALERRTLRRGGRS